MQKILLDDRIKPFRLVKYFTIVSLAAILIGAIVLSVLNVHWAKAMHMKKSEDYALVLIENLNHQIFLQFVIPVVLKYGKIELSNSDQFDRMDTIVRSTLHSFKADMVNIYDINNTISYSFDKDMVGRKNLGGTGFEYALEGSPTSKLVQRGDFWMLPLGFPKESWLITYAPLRVERQFLKITGPVLGVVEIVQDISEDYQSILHYQTRVLITCTAVMSVLLIIMVVVVKRGETIIHQRNLEQLQLKEKLAQAERLSSLGGMVAGISHEIRNPLGIIKSSAELLKKKAAIQDPSNNFPDIIVEESNRLNNIITDFLNYAKPRAPHFIFCRIEDIIEKNVAFLTPQLEQMGYIIHRNYAENLPSLSLDSDMTYQAFLNILMNAMEAMPSGGEITVSVTADEKSLHVHIVDQGDGISDDIINKIWDPFFTCKEKGTGLGLGIVKNIIESQHGIISITNRSDQSGVMVHIELPIQDKESNGNHSDC
jgi:signal transduction histidine kinase